MDPFGMEIQCNLPGAGGGGGGGTRNQSPSPLGAVRTNLVSPVEAVATGMLTTPPAQPIQPLKPVMSSPSTPNDPEQQHEKTDCTPENSKKSDGDTPVDAPDGARSGVASAGADEKGVSLQDMLKGVAGEEPPTKEASTEASVAESVRNAFAFTIDFGDGRKAVDTQRHEKMLERFQARHRRGESLSKLESASGVRQMAVAPSSTLQQQQQQRVPQSVNLPRRNRAQGADSGAEQQPMMMMEMMVDVSGGRPVAVKLREKNQRSVGRDQVPGKRHSWSPRTSVNEAVMNSGGAPNQRDTVATAGGTPKGVSRAASAATKGRFAPKSTTLALALEHQQATGMKDSSCSSSEFNAESMDSSGGIPCLEAPLENFRTAKGDGDEVSETGTYTLDGDNYTEEQKQRMNIDRISGGSAAVIAAPVIAPGPTDRPVRPTAFREELEVIDLERLATSTANAASDSGHTKPAAGTTAPEKRKHNILEVSYFHEPAITMAQSAGAEKDRTKAKQSYMEKLKSRMKNITQGGKASHERKQCLAELESPDQGTFTSVTTSGILSLKPTLEDNPKVVARRRNSLSKSHIDSSEYVQGVAKLNIHGTETEEAHPAPGDQQLEHKILNCYTDSEKAQQHGMMTQGSPQAAGQQQTGENRHRKTPSDVAALTSVTSKKDWIQEWAKNAREFSKTTSPKVHPHEPPTVPAYGRPVESAGGTVPPSMVRSYGGESTNHPRNQFGYDYDIDMAKSDYYESARKYEEFGDNLDHRREQQQQQQQQLSNYLRGSSGASARRGPHAAGSGIISPPNETMNEFTRAGSRGSMRRYAGGSNNPSPVGVSSVSVASKPPMSPSKIPSPIGSIGRTRSLSRNRSLQGSNSDLSGNETEMYLQKTAAAISTLQNLQRRNSMRNSSSHSSPLSPASRKMSPKVSPMNSLHSPLDSPSAIYPLEKTLGGSYVTNGSNSTHYSPQHLHHQQQLQRHLQHQLHQSVGAGGHKRNHSLDGTTPDALGSPLHSASYLANGGGGGATAGHMTRSLNTANTSPKMDLAKRNHAHTRHNSYEGVMSSLPPKPIKCFQQFDQPNVTGYYATEEGSGGVGEGELDDCADYDEEEFEEDIDDDAEEEERDRHRILLSDQTTLNAMPRPRAMSLEPRRAAPQSASQSAAMQSHKTHNIHSTGAKQALSGGMVRDNTGGAGVTTRAQIRAQRTVASAGHQQQQQQQHLTSPIKRSSSFSVKQTVVKPTTPTLSAKGTTPASDRRSMGGSKIQKSASSTSFKKMMAMDNVQPQQYHHHAVQPPHHRHQLVMDPNYPDELMLYINDDGDDDGLQLQIGGNRQAAGGYSSNSLTDEEDDDDDEGELLDEEDDSGIRMEKEPLTNTRYNKTFLMRMEQNKKIAAGATRPDASSSSGKQTTSGGGAAACPNTPELPRRAAATRMGALGRDRASMPRDSSLNRMKQDLNMRKSSAGRESMLGGKGNQQQLSSQSIASTVSSAALPSAGKVQPKYLDISKYKSSNAANFLKKDESKSYLLRQEGVRKSPSSASVSSAMSRTDPTRMSARSIRSASSTTGSKSSGTGGSAGTGAAKKDPLKIAKEQELEMWRRRASYDPMKAALEGKKKQLEEAKRIAAQQQQQQLLSERQSKSNESSVLRSQSYHSGVVNIGGGTRLYQGSVSNSSNANLRGAAYNQSSTLGDPTDCDVNNRWTLTSTESSEDLDGDYYIN
ncbi:uncharacterized protein LOC125956262 isoform X1 [Anopheles darlingi]|uniref:uncharacterized protein LOC125956262 isoform X1 n=1 Tax=Anopheles darlingi TaxID=43151 RepID=UPI0020FFFA33|nr:uncharacterized protein LOC125956262 isoform X1 [Anopheles darlingi]XP_049543917.1 uncharacterized protein LOC125956262 isoform X1 [Anopheles darlingi]